MLHFMRPFYYNRRLSILTMTRSAETSFHCQLKNYLGELLATCLRDAFSR